MPRRRPVREQRTRQSIPQVAGVSAPTLRAIATFERSRFGPGSVARALAVWSRFVHGPDRVVHGHEQSAQCPCCEYDGPDWNRTILRITMHALSTKAARELLRLVRPLDELYLTRSIPSQDNADLRSELTVD